MSIGVLLVGCADSGFALEKPSTSGCASSGVGEDSFCTVNGLRLHFVDWGGDGPAVLLLAGLGDSARIFDEFAPLLVEKHRVIAVTRRGFGTSASPTDSDYSNEALVGDLLGLMDELGFSRASFVGHSIAGGELAALGARHPDRVERLVYIDAAYDRTQVPNLMANLPPLPTPGEDVVQDLQSLVEWHEQRMAVSSPAIASNLSQVLVPSAEGWLPRTSSAVGALVLEGDIDAVPQWSAITAPSLALFSSKDIADQVPAGASAAQRRAMLDYSIRFLRPWMLRAQADFLENTPCAAALEVPRSTHYLFLERPEWTADVTLSFLGAIDPCHWSGGETILNAAGS